jgi:hypothetical protein
MKIQCVRLYEGVLTFVCMNLMYWTLDMCRGPVP